MFDSPYTSDGWSLGVSLGDGDHCVGAEGDMNLKTSFKFHPQMFHRASRVHKKIQDLEADRREDGPEGGQRVRDWQV